MLSSVSLYASHLYLYVLNFAYFLRYNSRSCDGKGCKRRYHLSCLNPPLNYVPPGVWHCVWCVKKKMEMGVHSVSEEVESIWDAREVASDHEGMLQNTHGICLIFFNHSF